ncbi:hypothetical protein AHF37_02901 [Paragonimus kellicotti]|nr:hypothetical protein AHF37_02901 [Paragonimus kellicotti]
MRNQIWFDCTIRICSDLRQYIRLQYNQSYINKASMYSKNRNNNNFKSYSCSKATDHIVPRSNSNKKNGYP